MAQTINTNVMSLNSQRNLNQTNNLMATSIQRLSTGLRVNSAKDDAAGLAIAERMSSQIRGMNVAMRNANDGISLAQTAEGALGKVSDMAQRMRELAVQSANVTNDATDRAALDLEFQELGAEITRTIAGTEFNGLNITAGDAGDLVFQIGSGTTANDTITVTTKDMSAEAGITDVTGGNITTVDDSTTAMDNIDSLLTLVNTERATYGATQNRFEAVVSTLEIASENQSAARGRIMDADFASETANMTRAQVLQQAGTAMLSQANSAPQNVLSLLR
ncbi:MAG: flagellin [Burkholderiaceae bacterium]